LAAAGLEEAPDEALVKAFVGTGDQQALETLLRRHESRVFGMAYRILGNRADALDAAQDVFLTVFRRAKSFRHHSAFSTWLHRLTVNACHDLSRKKARAPVPQEPHEKGISAKTSTVETRIVVEEALTRLPTEQRSAVVMRDIYQLTYEEISSATGAPVGTVKSRIARGRLALAAELADTFQQSGQTRNSADPGDV